MPRIPFPLGFEGSENLPQTNQTLQNCFRNDKGHILARPGISQLNTTGGVARGQFEFNGSLYQVASTSLIKISNTTTGAFTTIGTIAGSASIETAVGFTEAVIVVPSGQLYTLSTADALVDITSNTNFVSCADVAFINNRFVYIPANGDPAFFSRVGAAGTVDADAFFDAEELPDKNSAVFNLRNTLYIAGTDSIEPFRDTGASPVPFIRIQGASIPVGFIGGLLDYGETFLFIGRKKNQNAGIFALGEGTAIKISNERIDLLLSTYTNDELAIAIPGRIIWRGYDIATFALGKDSFGFLNGAWFILDSTISETSRPWGGGFITEFEGEYFTAFDNKIGKFDAINTDYGERITRIIGIAAQQTSREYMSVQSIELGLSQGFNSAKGSVAIRMTRDNVTFGPELYVNTGDIGEYNHRLRWNPPGGLGTYEGFFGFEIFTTEDIDFNADHIIAEIR